MRIADVNLAQATVQKVIELLREDQKIDAVKLVLNKTNSGLKRSKDAVDEIHRRMKRGEL
jgi:ribosomal protein L7/L12